MNELAAESLRRAGRLRLRVTGSSMLPAVCPDDILFIRACDIRAVRRGDIVAFLREGRFFVHRAIGHRDGHVLTRGDSNAAADPLVGPADFLGKVARIASRGSARRPSLRPPAVHRLAAALFRRSPLAGRLFTRVRAWWQPAHP